MFKCVENIFKMWLKTSRFSPFIVSKDLTKFFVPGPGRYIYIYIYIYTYEHQHHLVFLFSLFLGDLVGTILAPRWGSWGPSWLK